MIKIALVGDVFISRNLPDKGYKGLDEIVRLINEHEVKFANLETTIHNREGYPSAFPGGTWAMADPRCTKNIKRLGFNIVNTANNHSMDYSHGGMLATLKNLRSNDILYAGSGENLADASAPTYIECSNGRIAIIGATSSFHDSDAAGHQRSDMRGRPGVNPLRHKSIYELTENNFQNLQRIAEASGINSYHNQAIREGYLLPKENLNFADVEFVKGEKNQLHTFPLEKDMERIKKAIIEAKKQSDYVIVSIHSHQFSYGDKKHPAEFIKRFSKSCIDSGASIIVGHGPHVLRGIEVYNSGVIFYGLGNFIFQNETVSHLPADFYEKYLLQNDDGIGTAMDKRTNNGTIGLNVDENAWKSVVASIEIDSNIQVKLYPVELGFELPRYKKGLPRLSDNLQILEKIKELSTLYGTEIQIVEGVGIVSIAI
ncbi:MAG: CapA family protein [Bacteroidetes bacterium]|nr:CapA family protein [Bacteroidota bacterium]